MDNKLLDNENKINESPEDMEDITAEVEEIMRRTQAEYDVEDIYADSEDKEYAYDEPAATVTETTEKDEIQPPKEKKSAVVTEETEKKEIQEEKCEKEEKEATDTPFLKTEKGKKMTDKVSGILLALLTAIPSLILAYILILFFLT
ncbi:MAG: hypothetical protein IJX97_06060 [Clostridia bacterium]|nr:hypothetical protein [Clostridia bacterium]